MTCALDRNAISWHIFSLSYWRPTYVYKTRKLRRLSNICHWKWRRTAEEGAVSERVFWLCTHSVWTWLVATRSAKTSAKMPFYTELSLREVFNSSRLRTDARSGKIKWNSQTSQLLKEKSVEYVLLVIGWYLREGMLRWISTFLWEFTWKIQLYKQRGGI